MKFIVVGFMKLSGLLGFGSLSFLASGSLTKFSWK
jgi:hypothetical protein